jgi:hypothetical protein
MLPVTVDRVRLVHELWEALERGEVAPLEAALASAARWRAVEDGPWNCDDRTAILEVITRNRANGLSGRIEDAFEVGDRVVVAFRPDRHGPDAWPLDNGIRYVVASFAGDELIEIKGCADREVALAYAGARRA